MWPTILLSDLVVQSPSPLSRRAFATLPHRISKRLGRSVYTHQDPTHVGLVDSVLLPVAGLSSHLQVDPRVNRAVRQHHREFFLVLIVVFALLLFLLAAPAISPRRPPFSSSAPQGALAAVEVLQRFFRLAALLRSYAFQPPPPHRQHPGCGVRLSVPRSTIAILKRQERFDTSRE